MTPIILTLRFTKRAIGAAAIRSGEMSLLDGRFLSPLPDRVVPVAMRYVRKLLELTKPTHVVIDAPGSDGSTIAAEIRREVERALSESGIPIVVLDRGDILAAFGIRQVADRRTLRELVAILWPDVERIDGKVKPFVADAAAAALYGECQIALLEASA